MQIGNYSHKVLFMIQQSLENVEHIHIDSFIDSNYIYFNLK